MISQMAVKAISNQPRRTRRPTPFHRGERVAVAARGDHVFVAAAGSEPGLSLFQLLPGGRLLHLDTLADHAGITLADISALDMIQQHRDEPLDRGFLTVDPLFQTVNLLGQFGNAVIVRRFAVRRAVRHGFENGGRGAGAEETVDHRTALLGLLIFRPQGLVAVAHAERV